MEGTADRFDALLRSGARRLTGYQRRWFQAEVATELCGGSARLAERRFGWGRDPVEKGLHESPQGVRAWRTSRREAGNGVKRRTRNWRRTSARSSIPLRTLIRNSSHHVGTRTCRPPRCAKP